MWLRVVLLLIYVAILFLLARVIETLSWVETGNLSRRLLDPMAMSVLRLKALLEQRGVSYDGVVEKSELTDLVDATGPVSEEELDGSSATVSEEETATLTNFTCGSHFYEQVEDAKDSVWLVKVVVDRESPGLGVDNDSGWRALQKKVTKFGIRVGRFDCSLDWRLCQRKGWNTSRLVLALPQDFRTKANVVIFSYPGPVRVNSAYEWVRARLEEKVVKINDYDQLKSDWLSFKDITFSPEVRVVLFTQLTSLPLFLAALSVKFPGRVKIGTVQTHRNSGKKIVKKMNLEKLPTYMVITSEKTYLFGTRPGEPLTFDSMEKFLRSLYPGANDLFIVSLIFCNVLCLFELCLVQGSIFRRLCKFILCFLKYNFFLILLWLPLLGIFQLHFMERIIPWAIKLLRFCTGSYLACLVRKDVTFYSFDIELLLFTLVTYMTVIGILEYNRKKGQIEEETDSNLWNFAQFRSLNYLFNPAASYIRNPMGFYTSDLEQSIELFGNQLGPPSLWLKPAISSDYIKDLTTWHHRTIVTAGSDVPFADKKTMEELSNNAPLSVSESLDSDHANSCHANKRCCCHGNATHARSLSADLLMDSNYTCDCKKLPNATEQAATKTVPVMTEHECGMQEKKSGNCDRKPAETGSMPAGFLECAQCVICLDNYHDEVVLCGLPCGHSFHEHCILAWLTLDNHFCPVCRWPSYKAKSCQVHVHVHSE